MDWRPTRRHLYSILYVGELASASWSVINIKSCKCMLYLFICLSFLPSLHYFFITSNNLYFVQKYVLIIFVCRHYLFQEQFFGEWNSRKTVSSEKQIKSKDKWYAHIFMQYRGYCVHYPLNIANCVKKYLWTAYCIQRGMFFFSAPWYNLMNKKKISLL